MEAQQAKEKQWEAEDERLRELNTIVNDFLVRHRDISLYPLLVKWWLMQVPFMIACAFFKHETYNYRLNSITGFQKIVDICGCDRFMILLMNFQLRHRMI